ncbi:MAG: phosphate ABC transporter substrate-binding protein [Candidatus Melainabacteria bacterium]|nr:phosphate ABC transporter substrate-binding protein [Candidatus Melainabacteria bacterium]
MRIKRLRFNKRKLIIISTILLVFALLTQFSILCTQSFAKSPRLVLVGSTTLLPLSEHLATNYRKEVGVEVLVQGGGSTAGINAVLNNIAHVGASSRKLSFDEQQELKPFVIARDAIAIVVHPSNPIKDISIEDLRKVLSGEIINWKELGLPFDKPILLINDSAGAGTRAAIMELVMGKSKEENKPGTPITLQSVVVNSSSEMKANIANLKYGLGYLPFNYLDNKVKAISVNKVVPSYAAAYKGEYPLFRDLYYAIKKDSTDIGLAYIYYVLSPEGQDVVVQEGFLPVKLITSSEELDRIRKGVDN